MNRPSLGAYILPGDPVWLEKSLTSYYPILDDLVVPIPTDGRGWRGQKLPLDEVLAIIGTVDHRGIARRITGTWSDPARPMAADTAQRQAALNALRGRVDWVLQIDSDEYLPVPAALLGAVRHAEAAGLRAVEWPMRVLYRRTARSVFEVVGDDGSARYDYPGPVAVRPDVTLVDARRAEGPFLRAVVAGDDVSLQLRRPPEPGEERWPGITGSEAIVHNSWARTPAETWRKIRGWGHAAGARGVAYYLLRWLPAPLCSRWMRDVHPFARGLWPRLARRSPPTRDLLE